MKGPRRAVTDEFYGFIESRKRSIFVIEDGTFTAVERDAKL